MKAIVQSVYGSADVLEFIDIDVPAVGDDEVLIRVQAAGLHIGDWHVMTGLPYMLRAVGFGLSAPNVRVRGMDVAGTPMNEAFGLSRLSGASKGACAEGAKIQ